MPFFSSCYLDLKVQSVSQRPVCNDFSSKVLGHLLTCVSLSVSVGALHTTVPTDKLAMIWFLGNSDTLPRRNILIFLKFQFNFVFMLNSSPSMQPQALSATEKSCGWKARSIIDPLYFSTCKSWAYLSS